MFELLLRHPRVRRLRRRLRRLKRRAFSKGRKVAAGLARRLPVTGRSAARTASASAGTTRTRLVPAPTFVLATPDGGAASLRGVLDRHPEIHATRALTPPVTLEKKYAELAVTTLDLDNDELEHLLWDRVLHRELGHSGKRIVVAEAPQDADRWRRLATCWPDARYVFLLRHPAAMVDALLARQAAAGAGPGELDEARAVQEVCAYVKQVDEARRLLPGITVRFEDLQSDPVTATRQLCAFLRVRWSPRMLQADDTAGGDGVAASGPSGRDSAQLRAAASSWGYAD